VTNVVTKKPMTVAEARARFDEAEHRYVVAIMTGHSDRDLCADRSVEALETLISIVLAEGHAAGRAEVIDVVRKASMDADAEAARWRGSPCSTACVDYGKASALEKLLKKL
jgi:hypothetical protein